MAKRLAAAAGLLVSSNAAAAEKGSGLPTIVGVTLPNLNVGQVLDPTTAELFFRDGDGNQEDITNDAIAPWSTMPCHRFEFSDNPAAQHGRPATDVHADRLGPRRPGRAGLGRTRGPMFASRRWR